MGIKSILFYISHFSGHSFPGYKVNHKAVNKLREKISELRKVVRDESILKNIDEYLEILNGIILSERKQIDEEVFNKLLQLEEEF